MKASVSREFVLVIVLSFSCALPVIAQQGGRGDSVEGAANPLQGNEQAIAQGRELYNQNCTSCHGINGAAGEFGPALGLPGRRYGATTPAEIFGAIRKGIAGTLMPPHSQFSDNQIWQITAYLQGLRGTAIDAPTAGNAVHGQEVFWGKGQCGECHSVRGKGGLIGPDLTDLAASRKTATITDALTNPKYKGYGEGQAIRRQLEPLNTYQTVRVTTADGSTIRGVLKNEDSFSLQILGLDNELHLLERGSLKNVQYERERLMPSDYDKRLTAEEFQDLLAFLTRLAVPAPRAAPAQQ